MRPATRKLIANSITAVALSVLAGVGAAACASSNDNLAPNAPTEATPNTDADGPTLATKEAQFYVVVDAKGIVIDHTTETAIAQEACGLMDAGQTPIESVMRVSLNYPHYDATDIAYVVGAGSQAYCPQNSLKIANAGN